MNPAHRLNVCVGGHDVELRIFKTVLDFGFSAQENSFFP